MTPQQRHLCMSHIRSKDTKPEQLVRQALWHKGFRYRLHVKDLPGKPDIVLPKYKTAIFVNGCFWHGHKGCKEFVIPKSNCKKQVFDQQFSEKLDSADFGKLVLHIVIDKAVMRQRAAASLLGA